MKRMACSVTLLALLVLAGCGSISRPAPAGATAVSASPQAPPRSSPIASQAPALTEADAGRVIQVGQGTVVSVALHEASGFSPWSPPATSDRTVLVPVVNTRAASARGVTLASFQATGAGVAQLTSSAGPDCPQNAACPALAMSWTLTVEVS